MSTSTSKKIYVLFLFFSMSYSFGYAQSASEESGYRLGPGDRIFIQVFDESDLTMTTTIGESGSINYSYLGDILVTGKTALALEKEIVQLLANGYLVNPSVNISIEEYRPFFIYGEVRSPGGYSYQPGLTMEKAIAIAGGLTDRASRRKIFIAREAEGKKSTFKASLSTSVRPDDIVTVKEGFF